MTGRISNGPKVVELFCSAFYYGDHYQGLFRGHHEIHLISSVEGSWRMLIGGQEFICSGIADFLMNFTEIETR